MTRRALWVSVLLAVVVAMAGIPAAVACETPSTAGCCCPSDAPQSDCGMTSCAVDETWPAPQAALPDAPTLLAVPVVVEVTSATVSTSASTTLARAITPFDSPPTYLLDCTFRL